MLQLPRKKEDNPLWHAIHEHSWDKVTTWAQRVSGKWDHRMQQALKAGQALSYKNGAVAADMRDSGKELNVWYMAQAMCYFDDHFQKALKPDRFDQVKSDWLAGKLDTQILPAVLAKRKDFQPRDFQFVLLEQQDALSGLNFLSLGSSEKQESLQRLHKQLGQEQKAWRAHMAKVKAHEDSSMGSFNRQVSRQQEALEEAWQEQSTKFIQVFSCADVAGAILLVNQAKAMIADEQLKDASGIPCIFEWNFPKAGARASKLIPAVASTIAVSCSENPKTVIHVVIPPCQPVYGKGDSAGDERIASIEDHVNNLWQQLNDPSHRLSVRKVNALWNSETFYSSDRELGFEVWLVLAESTRDVSKSTRSYNNVFGNSSLLKRGAFPFLLNAMERKDFQNWKAPLGFDQGKVAHGQDTAQWFSGVQVFCSSITELRKGSILQKDDFLLVADMLMYDSEPGKGCVELNCGSNKEVPRLAFVGVSWAHEKGVIRTGSSGFNLILFLFEGNMRNNNSIEVDSHCISYVLSWQECHCRECERGPGFSGQGEDPQQELPHAQHCSDPRGGEIRCCRSGTQVQP